MKAPEFSYRRARSLDEVFDLLDQYGDEARLLAGGQTLLATLNMRLSAPRLLIDLNGLRGELAGLRVEQDTLTIGALTTHDELMQSDLIRDHLPLLAEAVPHVAHVAIRNAGTFGGSIALADPAAEYPCCAVVLQAQMVIAARGSIRRVPADQFFLGLYQTALKPDEVLIGVQFPVARPSTRSVFLELARRHGDYAMIGIAIHTDMIEDRCQDLRIAYLSAGDAPRLARHVAEVLEGQSIDASTIARAKQMVEKDIEPPADLTTSTATKLHLARVLTERALKRIAMHEAVS
jgi:carbon-monoxide dehydrogenase medium subunit